MPSFGGASFRAAPTFTVNELRIADHDSRAAGEISQSDVSVELRRRRPTFVGTRDTSLGEHLEIPSSAPGDAFWSGA